MSGATSTLWRTSLCGVAMALTVFSTGCAIQNVDADDAGEYAAEAAAGLTVAIPQHNGGLQAPKDPLAAHKITKGTAQAQSLAAKLEEGSEPEPEPWHPKTRNGDDDPEAVKLGTTPDRSDDHK